MAAGDLNIALILKLVDQVSAPARGATNALRKINQVTEQTGRSGVAWSNQQLEANRARQGALRGEAFGVLAVGAALAASLKPAIDFERAMAEVAAVARADNDQLARLTETARELGSTTPWAASQAAEGMRFLSMAGFEVNDTISAMPGMLDLASAGAIDLGKAADISSNILTGFGKQAGQMSYLGDVLTNTFTTSNTDLTMLGETMKYVAPVAAATGVELEQAAAMAGKLGDAGIQGTMAGTALRAMISRLSAPTSEAAKALNQLGVATADADGNLRDMPTILADMDVAMSDMGSAVRQEMVSTIFGLEAASAATVLLGQAGSGALQDYTASLKETGSAARVAERLNDNASGALKRMASVGESVAITLGTVLLPEFAALIETIVPVISAFEAWASANPEIIALTVKLTAGLIGLKLASVGLRFGLSLLLGPILQIVRAGSWMLVAVSKIGPALLTLLNPLKLVRGAMVALRLAVISTGVGALLAAIAAAGVLIYNNWDGLKEFFVGLWEGFRAALGPAAPMLDGVIGLFSRLWAWVTALVGPIDASADTWRNWGLAAGKSLGSVVSAVAEIPALISGAWDTAGAYLTDKVETIRAAFDDGLINGVFAVLSELNPFRVMLEGAQALWAYVAELVGIPDTINAAFADIDLFEAGVTMIQSLWDGAMSLVGTMVDAIGAKLTAIVPSWMKDAMAWVSGDDGSGSESLPRRDSGGPVRAGARYLVGERGAEEFVPGVSGSILPGRVLRAAVAASALAAPVAAAPSEADILTRVDTRPPLAATTSYRQVTNSIEVGQIVIQASPGMSAEDIAREVRRQLEDLSNAQSDNLFDQGDF